MQAADLNDWQTLVKAFNEKAKQDVGTTPRLPTLEAVKLFLDWQKGIIPEELIELVEAIQRNDLPEAADALVDFIYVILGLANHMGIALDPLFYAVHDANMEKFSGPIRDDGKQLKPEGWVPPDIAAELKLQGWEP